MSQFVDQLNTALQSGLLITDLTSLVPFSNRYTNTMTTAHTPEFYTHLYSAHIR